MDVRVCGVYVPVLGADCRLADRLCGWCGAMMFFGSGLRVSFKEEQMSLVERIMDRFRASRERRQKEREIKAAFTAYAVEAIRSGQATTEEAALQYAAERVEAEYGADPALWEFLNKLVDTFGPLLIELLRSLLL